MNDDKLILGFSAARVAMGTVLAAAPGAVARPWLGDAAGRPATKVAIRSSGIRDALLGAGTLIAARRGAPVRGWLEASAASDAGDLLSTLLAGAALPTFGRVAVPVFAAFGAVTGAFLARRVS